MAKIIRMIHAVTRLIPVLLEFQEARPNRRQIGKCDAIGCAKHGERIAILRKQLVPQRGPIAIAEQRRDQNELNVWQLLTNAVGDFLRVRFVVFCQTSAESFMPNARIRRAGLALTTPSICVSAQLVSFPPPERFLS